MFTKFKHEGIDLFKFLLCVILCDAIVPVVVKNKVFNKPQGTMDIKLGLEGFDLLYFATL